MTHDACRMVHSWPWRWLSPMNHSSVVVVFTAVRWCGEVRMRMWVGVRVY